MHCSILCTINTDMSLICSVDLEKQSLVICKSHIIMFSTKVESLCLIHNPPLYSNKQIREGKLFFQGRHVPKDTHVLKSACFTPCLTVAPVHARTVESCAVLLQFLRNLSNLGTALDFFKNPD